MNAPTVALSGLSKNYGPQRAVNNVDLTLQPGECVALAGHNGAGKSTLLKLTLGLLRPTEGRAIVLGHDACGKAAVRLRSQIGYMPETVALHPALTGAETLAFYARLKRQPVSGNAALLERVGIAAAAKRRVGGYSKGMRQRLALAQALLGRPRLLLFDEPTTGLDPASRQLFYEIVRELRNEGATIVLCTHILSELEGQTDRIIVMKNGHKIADGSMSQLRSKAGLPIRIRIRVACDTTTAGALPGGWRRLEEGLFELSCTEHEKVAAIRGLASINLPIADIEISMPSVDDMYAHFLKRVDT